MDNRHILPDKIHGFFRNRILVGFTFENAPNVIARRVDYRDLEILFGHRILLRPGSGIWHVWRSFSTRVKAIKFQTGLLPIGGFWRFAAAEHPPGSPPAASALWGIAGEPTDMPKTPVLTQPV
jgi:hypothetical protein